MTTTQTSAPRRGRRILAGLSALTISVVLAGCSTTSPMSTELVYNPGDGITLDLGDVQVRDLLVLGTEEGAPATVIAYVVNRSPETEATVSFGDSEVTVPAGTALQVSPPGEAGLELSSLDAAPGAMVPVEVSVNGGPPAQVSVPVLTTDNPNYSDYGS